MINTYDFFPTRRSVVIVTLSLLFFSCSNKQQPGGGNTGMSAPTPTLKVMELQPRSVTLNNEYPASIQGQENIEIRPKVDGFIEKIYVDEGSIVKKGQLLFKVSNPQYVQDERTADAGIKTAQADVNTASLQVAKVKPLVEKDIVSHYELESAQLTLQSKKAALAQAEAALENARINVAYTTITSPVNGVIGSLPYKLGSLVNSATAQPLTTVYNTSTVYAYFAMNEKQLLDLSRDSTSSASLSSRLRNMPPITLILSDGTVYDHLGKVETVNGLINTATGSANVRAGFANPRGLLRAGSSAAVRIPKMLKDVLVVPQNVTYGLQDKHFVYLVDSQNKLTNVAVTVMDQAIGQFYVITGGVKTGNKIVAESANNLKDGTQIKPVEANTDNIYKGLK